MYGSHPSGSEAKQKLEREDELLESCGGVAENAGESTRVGVPRSETAVSILLEFMVFVERRSNRTGLGMYVSHDPLLNPGNATDCGCL